MLLNYLYSKPVITAADVVESLKVTKPTANTLVKDFTTLGILNEQTGFRRNRVFIFTEYLSLFNR
ncbi:MAG TPA: helix-turn-helix domain-containing protein [Puia sp.]|nr:helix-turn-helix domain-containing protein [Puia sp.]